MKIQPLRVKKVAERERGPYMYKGRQKGADQTIQRIRTITTGLLLLLVVGAILVGEHFKTSYYHEGTTIHGEDCSKLSVEDAKMQIEEANIMFRFADSIEHLESGKILGREICDTSELEEFLNFQHSKEGKDAKEITLTSETFSVNEETLRDYMKGIPQLKAENMKKPLDAKLFIGKEGFIESTSSAEGNEIDFEEAFDLAKSLLKNGENVIDFTSITNVEPTVKSDDPELLKMRQKVNKVLRSEIAFTLTDGSVYTLDKTS